MENLNAENIINEIQSLIKALKDCGGWVKRGNGEGWFNHEILADALSVITSQEQRIGELTEENERLRGEIEQHREINRVIRYLYATYAECFDNVDPNKDCDTEDLISRYGDLIKNKGETANESIIQAAKKHS